jgi:F-type H+-transporting ATPase subunit c
MEMANALLYIAGALMMGLGALGAAVGSWKALLVNPN